MWLSSIVLTGQMGSDCLKLTKMIPALAAKAITRCIQSRVRLFFVRNYPLENSLKSRFYLVRDKKVYEHFGQKFSPWKFE